MKFTWVTLLAIVAIIVVGVVVSIIVSLSVVYGVVVISRNESQNTSSAEPVMELNLTSFEIEQLGNINETTITSKNWTHVGQLDQDVSTSAMVQFDKSKVRNLDTESVNSLPIGMTQWEYLANQNQSINTSDNVMFNNINGNDVNVNDINANDINANNLTLNQINVNEIFATSIDVDNINAQNAFLWQIFADDVVASNYFGENVTLSNQMSALEIITNIVNGNNISNQQWQYLSELNQSLSTSNAVQFQEVITNIINGTPITNQQWQYLGNMDQDVSTSALVEFNQMVANDVLVNNDLQINKINNIPVSSNNIGHLANMNQNVGTGDSVSFQNINVNNNLQINNVDTIPVSSNNIGHLANMNQNVGTTDNVQFNQTTTNTLLTNVINELITASGVIVDGFHIKDNFYTNQYAAAIEATGVQSPSFSTNPITTFLSLPTIKYDTSPGQQMTTSGAHIIFIVKSGLYLLRGRAFVNYSGSNLNRSITIFNLSTKFVSTPTRNVSFPTWETPETIIYLTAGTSIFLGASMSAVSGTVIPAIGSSSSDIRSTLEVILLSN